MDCDQARRCANEWQKLRGQRGRDRQRLHGQAAKPQGRGRRAARPLPARASARAEPPLVVPAAGPQRADRRAAPGWRAKRRRRPRGRPSRPSAPAWPPDQPQPAKRKLHRPPLKAKQTRLGRTGERKNGKEDPGHEPRLRSRPHVTRQPIRNQLNERTAPMAACSRIDGSPRRGLSHGLRARQGRDRQGDRRPRRDRPRRPDLPVHRRPRAAGRRAGPGQDAAGPDAGRRRLDSTSTASSSRPT